MSELTANGASKAVVTIDAAGTIRHAGRRLASLKSTGDILVGEGIGSSGTVVGRIVDGRIWEVSASGHSVQPIGRILASLPGRQASVLSSPTANAPTIGHLRAGVAAELLQVHQSWYQVRLLNNRVGWVWAPVTTIATLIVLTDDEAEVPDNATIMLTNGSTLVLRHLRQTKDTLSGEDANGRTTIVDSSLIKWLDPAREDIVADTNSIESIEFSDGSAIAGAYCELGRDSVVELNTRGRWSYGPERRKRIVIDDELVTTDCT